MDAISNLKLFINLEKEIVITLISAGEKQHSVVSSFILAACTECVRLETDWSDKTEEPARNKNSRGKVGDIQRIERKNQGRNREIGNRELN